MKKTAAEMMTANVLTVAPDIPTSRAAAMILENGITALPVVDGEGQLLGIVSEDDLVRCNEEKRDSHRSWWLTFLTISTTDLKEAFGEGKQPVAEVMSRDVVTASEETTLRRLVAMLATRRIKQVPILRDNKLVGIVSRIDILRYLAQERTAF